MTLITQHFRATTLFTVLTVIGISSYQCLGMVLADIDTHDADGVVTARGGVTSPGIDTLPTSASGHEGKITYLDRCRGLCLPFKSYPYLNDEAVDDSYDYNHEGSEDNTSTFHSATTASTTPTGCRRLLNGEGILCYTSFERCRGGGCETTTTGKPDANISASSSCDNIPSNTTTASCGHLWIRCNCITTPPLDILTLTILGLTLFLTLFVTLLFIGYCVYFGALTILELQRIEN